MKFFQKTWVRTIVILILLWIVFVGVRNIIGNIEETQARKTLGVGAVVLPKDGEWNVVDVSGCKVSTIKSDLVKGIFLGPWDGLVHRTIGGPDMEAVYSETFLPVLPKDVYGDAHFELKASYPEARFFSYHLYNEKFVIEGDSHMSDLAIKPDAGSINPFVTGYPIPADKEKNYTIKIVDFAKLVTSSNDNVLYGGILASGEKVNYHSVFIRNYEPKRVEGQLPSLVDLPTVLFKYKDSDPISAEIKNNACGLINPSWYDKAQGLIDSDTTANGRVNFFLSLVGKIDYPDYMPAELPAYKNPEWVYGGNMVCTIGYIFPKGFGGWIVGQFLKNNFAGKTPEEFARDGQCDIQYSRGAFNFDNKYMFAFLDAKRGSIVMHMKALRAQVYGQPMAFKKDEDVRYWSICSIQAENVGYTYDCARDDQFVKDPGTDNLTIIFTKLDEKPDWACDVGNLLGKGLTPGCRANWFPYASSVTWVYMRTLVGNPASENYKYLPITFDLQKEAAGDPNDFTALAKHMGPYYPAGEYCTFDKTKTGQKSCEELLK